jgi:transformation/transcription domain-associated protein
MNLLLRVIIPALDSSSGDLVNLGLRTLEFWVDNLNPLFLIPEISKQSVVFTSLMQSLSRHLRPAPYPYGLLTLRLLGKLGGKNRQFLREPFVSIGSKEVTDDGVVTMSCNWNTLECGSAPDPENVVNLPLPIGRCVAILRMIANSRNSWSRVNEADVKSDVDQKEIVLWGESARLWTVQIDRFDVIEYQRDVIFQTKKAQATACTEVLRRAARAMKGGCDKRANGSQSQEVETVLLGLMYAGMLDSTRIDAIESLKMFVSFEYSAALQSSVSVFLHEADPATLAVVIDILQILAKSADEHDEVRDTFFGDLLSTLCKACATCNWGERESLYGAIQYLVDFLGQERSRKNELELITTIFVSVKSVPADLSSACASALRFFFHVCVGLYGKPWSHEGSEGRTIWDALETGVVQNVASASESSASSSVVHRPCNDVIRLVLAEIAASQDIVRCAIRGPTSVMVSMISFSKTHSCSLPGLLHVSCS